jgi:hypothetical protein
VPGPGVPVPGGGDPPPDGPRGGWLLVVLGGRMMKQDGPALRWLDWAAVGLRVVFT